MSWWKRLKYLVQIGFYGAVILFVIGPAAVPLSSEKGKIRTFTRADEFDYVEWTVDTVLTKVSRAALDTADYLDLEAQRQVVLDYLVLVSEIQTAEAQLSLIYADPMIESPEETAQPISAHLDELYARREELGPLAESVLQEMVSAIVHQMGFTPSGQPIPPVMYHSTPLPWALIVSPRDAIQQDANISLETSLTVEDHIQLEEAISETLDVSALVVPIGGVGTYPTMVAQTTSLNWLAEVISHEWIHNYLTLRPLGVRYEVSPELRTINETTANLAGKEIGALLIETYFPEFAPQPVEPAPVEETEETTQEEEPVPADEPPAFDFRAEMHETRVTVDALLSEGKIEEAEAYMEARRVFLWEHGYQIRKLNQAYFAFHGAYADVAGGSAGEDPVGAAVRQLRAESDTLIDFIDRISRVRSYGDLQEMVENE